jgi:hypothetical protein
LTRLRVRLSCIPQFLSAVALVGATGWYCESFALWPGQAIPSHLHWCGRDFSKNGGGPVSLTQAQLKSGGRDSQPWQQVGALDFVRFSSPGVYGSPWSATTQHKLDLYACAVELYVKTGADEYVGYTLSGSP